MLFTTEIINGNPCTEGCSRVSGEWGGGDKLPSLFQQYID